MSGASTPLACPTCGTVFYGTCGSCGAMVASRVGIPHVGQPVIGSAGTGGFATQDPHGAFQTSGTMHAPEGSQPEQKEMAQSRETSGESAPRMPPGEH